MHRRLTPPPDQGLGEPVRRFEDTFSGAEMLEGYRDGLMADSPEPSANRSDSYRHGFTNGRDDRAKRPRASADAIREQAKVAIENDEKR